MKHGQRTEKEIYVFFNEPEKCILSCFFTHIHTQLSSQPMMLHFSSSSSAAFDLRELELYSFVPIIHGKLTARMHAKAGMNGRRALDEIISGSDSDLES